MCVRMYIYTHVYEAQCPAEYTYVNAYRIVHVHMYICV